MFIFCSINVYVCCKQKSNFTSLFAVMIHHNPYDFGSSSPMGGEETSTTSWRSQKRSKWDKLSHFQEIKFVWEANCMIKLIERITLYISILSWPWTSSLPAKQIFLSIQSLFFCTPALFSGYLYITHLPGDRSSHSNVLFLGESLHGRFHIQI